MRETHATTKPEKNLSSTISGARGALRALILVLFTGVAACGPPVQVVPVTTAPVRTAPSPTVDRAEPAEPVPSRYEGVLTGRFDRGKMWTFDNPPLDYFQAAYGIAPDSNWFNKARSAALRLGTYCSASFVSATGLVMTNHHCARESITEVTQPGEDLLESGFVAGSMDEERKVDDLFVDQLVSIRDITDEVYAAETTAMSATSRAEARDARAEALEVRFTSRAKAADSTRFVEVIPLYNGGRYAAYTYRRYEDVRLVMAPEVQIGFFGGDFDNFTYPRYNLDASFFRVYGDDGKPLVVEHFFGWSTDGASEGDPVFVVGNPGSTNRMATVSQLEYLRDFELPLTLDLLARRADMLQDYIRAHPADADSFDLKNAYFGIENTRKNAQGQLTGLESDWLIKRRGASDEALQIALAASDSLDQLYSRLFDEITAVQGSKEASIESARAFAFFLNPDMSSRILSRSMYGYVYNLLKQRGAPPDRLKEIRDEGMEFEPLPAALEKSLIALRLEELRTSLGSSDPSVRRVLGDMTPEEVAALVVDSTALRDSTGLATLMTSGYLSSKDATVPVIEVLGPLYFTINQQLENFQQREQALNARLARARFAVNGLTEPPDASFSLRIADGVVAGYEYNGTKAPAFTTYYGMYDRYYSGQGREDWLLPDRWINPPETFDYETPLNLVSTNDITGGNSGSPLLNARLEVVGLAFDSNIEALPNEFLYTDTAGRTVSVDARAILEALDDIYDADWLVEELTGRGGQD